MTKDISNRIQCFKPLINQDTRILILGTIPGAVSLALEMYYGHENNHFWDFMYRILDPKLTKDELVKHEGFREEHYGLLLKHGIGLWDVISDCLRPGSNDSKIKDPHFNRIAPWMPPSVEIIFCNGKKVHSYLRQSGELKLINVPIEILGSTSSMNPINTFKTYNNWNNALRKHLRE